MKRRNNRKQDRLKASNRQAAAALTALVVAQGAAAVGQTNTNTPPAPPSPSTNNPAAQLPEVVVQGQQDPGFNPETLSSPRFTEPLRNLPQTITVVPQAVIESRGASTLRDVLRNVPGISMQAGEGGGGLPGDNLSIRGFNARSDIFIDGVRDTGAYSRDPFNIQQVEVFKGPTSATAGRGSTGGSVNLVSKTPQLDRFYSGTLGFGTDDYTRLTADLNQPIDELPVKGAALRLNGLWHDAGVPGRDIVEESRWSVAPSFTVGLETPTRISLSYLHMEQDNVPDYGIPWVPVGNTNAVLSRYINKAPPVDFDNFYGIKGYDFEDVISRLGTVIIDHDFSSTFSLRNLSRYGQTDRSSAITAPRFADLNPDAPVESDQLINRQLQRRDMENRVLANLTDAKIEFPTGPVEHTTVGGFEVSREDQDNRNSAQTFNQPQTDIFNPTPRDRPLGPMPPNIGAPNEVTAITLAPYVFDTIK
ncbi:MAG TPA: TonB-dependent receptor plug domain-containing protein, partial [Verrucomicrobiae bacterium]|nr:TonB-dependent receptor plug domain-containing protein [Verrucomicrobiae bacterium]